MTTPTLDINKNRSTRKYTRQEVVARILWSTVRPFFHFSPRPFFDWRRFLLRLFGARIPGLAGKFIFITPPLFICPGILRLVTGPVSDQDKWQLYRSADLCVQPSYTENFGIVIAEALASGTPVITTKGTPWEELQTYNCGWCVVYKASP